jgi:mono/diheme cytochrome c family protein
MPGSATRRRSLAMIDRFAGRRRVPSSRSPRILGYRHGTDRSASPASDPSPPQRKMTMAEHAYPTENSRLRAMRAVGAMLVLILACTAALTAAAAENGSPDGQKIFKQMCAGCHGNRGDGGTGHRGGFSPHVTTLANKEYMAGVTDDYLMFVIKNGGAAAGKMATMPAWGKRLSDEQIRSIIALIRQF